MKPFHEARRESPDDDQELAQLREDVWGELKLPAVEFEDEKCAPTIDEDTLRSAVLNFESLSANERREIAGLTARFRSWARAVGRFMVERDARRSNSS
jgi:hypothetical protein